MMMIIKLDYLNIKKQRSKISYKDEEFNKKRKEQETVWEKLIKIKYNILFLIR